MSGEGEQRKKTAHLALLAPQMVLNLRHAANFVTVYEDKGNTISNLQVLQKIDPAFRNISLWKNMYILDLRTRGSYHMACDLC